jgi:hypothetical protein
MSKFTSRPEGAAPLFDSNSGKSAAKKRWDAAREASESALVAFANDSNPNNDSHSLEEATDYVVRNPQFQASIEGKTAAAKFVSQQLDLLPAGGAEQAVVQDNRQLHVHQFTLDRKSAIAYARDLEEDGSKSLAKIVEAQIKSSNDELIELTVPMEND